MRKKSERQLIGGNGMDLILVGFMGSGKTTIGRLLANRLGKDYFDLDEMIVERAGMSIPEIFKILGEEEFRKIEQQCLKDAEQLSGVLGTGGGTPTFEGNQQILIQMGAPVVLLQASIETTLSRIAGNDDRPLVTKFGPDGLKHLLEQRQADYGLVSDVQIVTDNLAPMEVVHKIVNQIKVVE